MGIGANTAMLGIIHGMLIRPLPYPDGERIVRVGQEPRQMPGTVSGFGATNVTSLRPVHDLGPTGAGHGRGRGPACPALAVLLVE